MNQNVINALQASLRAHWTAVEQYTSQSAHFARWGYSKLAGAAHDDAKEERAHAKRLLARLEYFDTVPAYDHTAPVWPRHDLVGILASNLALENAAAQIERDGIIAARTVGDETTATLFTVNLADSEESIRAIEADQKQIAQMGLENFLSCQR